MTITRREWLGAVAKLAPTLAWQLAERTAYSFGSAHFVPALREAAAAAGLMFGSDSDFSFRDVPPAYEHLFVRQCALYAGNLNWRHLAPDPSHEHIQADPNAAIALAAGLKLTGAHLLWYRSIPGWFDNLPPKEAREALISHIRSLAGYYRGRCFSWNVINEAIEPGEHSPDGLRTSTSLRRILDSDLLEYVFTKRALRIQVHFYSTTITSWNWIRLSTKPAALPFFACLTACKKHKLPSMALVFNHT